MQTAQNEESKEVERALVDSHAAAMNEDDFMGPNPDRMTYEQLLELGEAQGKVSRGLTREQIENNLAEPVAYDSADTARMSEKQCLICMEQFQEGAMVRILPCKHLYDTECIEEWLAKERRCPLCSKDPL